MLRVSASQCRRNGHKLLLLRPIFLLWAYLKNNQSAMDYRTLSLQNCLHFSDFSSSTIIYKIVFQVFKHVQILYTSVNELFLPRVNFSHLFWQHAKLIFNQKSEKSGKFMLRFRHYSTFFFVCKTREKSIQQKIWTRSIVILALILL